jgi:dynein intermediate chain
MADRVKKELEEKRAKLVELRRARDERKALLAQAEKGSTEVRPANPFGTSAA